MSTGFQVLREDGLLAVGTDSSNAYQLALVSYPSNNKLLGIANVVGNTYYFKSEFTGGDVKMPIVTKTSEGQSPRIAVFNDRFEVTPGTASADILIVGY
jgi:hypothetical protein